MFRFRCRQCRRSYPYRKIVHSHYICLGCYAWARGAHQRNKNKPLPEHEIDILLGGYEDYPYGCWWMLTAAQADYLIAHDQAPLLVLWTCSLCHHYYWPNDSGNNDKTICKWCEKELRRFRSR